MSAYKRIKFNKNEDQRIYLEKFLIKAIPLVASIILLVSLGFNFYLFNNHTFSQYWYIFSILSFLYICYLGLISIRFFLGLSGSFKLVFSNIIYRQVIKFYIYKYIHKSDNLIEKKYKILFLHLWFLSEDIFLHTSTPEHYFWKKIIERVDQELYKNLLGSGLALLYDKYEREDFFYFFNEDISNKEIFNIIKKIYKDYECCGMVMKKAFTDNRIQVNDAESILIIQDYSLTSADIDMIKFISEQINSYSYIDFNFNTEIFNEIVNKEDRTDILLLLKDMLTKLKNESTHFFIMSTINAYNQNRTHGDHKIDLYMKIVDRKIEYLTMKSELGRKDVVKKINKI
jgi:hypothetical protein